MKTARDIIKTTAVDYPKLADFLTRAMDMPSEVRAVHIMKYDDIDERSAHLCQACFAVYLLEQGAIKELEELYFNSPKQLIDEHWEKFLAHAVLLTFKKPK